MAVRYDTFTAKIEEKLDSNGFLNIKGRPTRAGVFIYRDHDGRKIRELRHPDDVFRSDSMQSLALKPFTLDHPGGLLNPQISQVNSHGTTGENISRTDDDCLECSISVQSQKAIEKIKDKGFIELSAGYRCDIKKEKGIYMGQQYDQRQINIAYNHVALVPKGRAGSQCRIRLDSDSAILANEIIEDSVMGDTVVTIKKEIPAVNIGKGENIVRLDSLQIEETPEIIPLLNQRRILIAEVDKAQTRCDRAEGERDQLKAEKEEIENQLKNAVPKERFDSEVKEYAGLLKMAEEIKLPDIEKLDNKGIKKAICKKFIPSLDDTRLDSSDDYLSGVFDPIKNDWKNKLSQQKTIEGIEFYDKNKSEGQERPLNYTTGR